MTRALLFHLDGKLPNLALMRLSAYLKDCGTEVIFRRGGKPERTLWELGQEPDAVYASCIFERTRPVAERLKKVYPKAIIGGTGWDFGTTLGQLGVPEDTLPDYSLYPKYPHSIGFTQRGCRLRCPFCVVPRKEGTVREATGIMGNDDDFKTRRIYTAWDNRRDESRLFVGLQRLVKYGVKPDHIMVYMLCGFWSGETEEDRLYRHDKLRDCGCRPYPMPFVRTQELIGFQRWCLGAYDKRITWKEWKEANCRPEKLKGQTPSPQMELVQIA